MKRIITIVLEIDQKKVAAAGPRAFDLADQLADGFQRVGEDWSQVVKKGEEYRQFANLTMRDTRI